MRWGKKKKTEMTEMSKYMNIYIIGKQIMSTLQKEECLDLSSEQKIVVSVSLYCHHKGL